MVNITSYFFVITLSLTSLLMESLAIKWNTALNEHHDFQSIYIVFGIIDFSLYFEISFFFL